MSNYSRYITQCFLISFVLCSSGFSKDTNRSSLPKPATVEFELFSSNTISSWIGNQGHLASHVPTGDSGCEWPAGSGKTTIFASGIWVLGQVDGVIRGATAEYSSDWTPGTIHYDTETKLPTSATPLNTTDHQVYYIQKGNSSNLSSQHYNREYATWPASDGAPAHDGEYFTDLNGNGSWDLGESFEDFNNNSNYDEPDGLLVTGDDPPRFVGDTQAWWVMNDWDVLTQGSNWNTPPLGVEAHVLVYTRSNDPILENVQFHSIKLVNKGGAQIDSTYFTYWTDPDIGDATDDLGGCDTSLAMAYYYNGLTQDRTYGLTAPAVGYTFMQGPLVESVGDTAWIHSDSFPDRRILGMTSSIMFLKSSNILGDPVNAEEAYYYMQGLQHNGDPILDPWGEPTPYHISGDPVAGDEWTAAEQYWVGDKRGIMSTGPFDMEPWDDLNGNGRADFGEPGVQVIEAALIIKSGLNNVDAITNLRIVAEYTRYRFNNSFASSHMESPEISVGSADQEIVLNWFDDADIYEANIGGSYEFEGYNLFQGESNSGPWTLLTTFDVVNGVGVILEQSFDEHGFLQNIPVQFGDDTGLEHVISIKEDYLNDGEPLVNNKAYYFAVDAYAYSSSALPRVIESEMRVISVRPHKQFDSADVGELLETSHEGDAEISLSIVVLDPSKLKGLDYELGFNFDSVQSLGQWHLINPSLASQDTLLVSPWFDEYNLQIAEQHYVDGFELSLGDVSFAPPAYKSNWEQIINIEGTAVETLTLRALSDGGVDSLGYDVMGSQLVHLDTLFGPDYYWDYYEIEERSDGTYFILYRANTHDVHIQGFASKFGGQGGDRLADIPGIGGGSNDPEFLQSDLEIRFTEQGQNASLYSTTNAFVPTIVNVPFEIWDIERNIQLSVGINDHNHSGSIQDTTLEDWENTLDGDWVIVFDRDYSVYGIEVDSLFNNPYSGWCWQFNEDSKFSIGDVVAIQFLNPVDPAVDVFRWSTHVAGVTYDEDALESIQVFPNPYFGYQSEQSSFSEPFVTISNLPEQECTIRIYSLGGQLVRRFDHEVGTYEYWDLLNDHRYPVASGVYILHIEVPELGNKILKLAILQPDN